MRIATFAVTFALALAACGPAAKTADPATCFGVDPPVALGMMGVQGGGAEPGPGRCTLKDGAGQPVAVIQVGPKADLQVARSEAGEAMNALIGAATATYPDAKPPARVETLTIKVKRQPVDVALYVRGFRPGDPVDEIGFVKGERFAIVRFYGRSEVQARRLIDQRLVKSAAFTAAPAGG
jgi:hypothetical protein